MDNTTNHTGSEPAAGDGIIVMTQENGGIAHFQMARCIAALSIEVNTGMKMSRGVSMLKVVQAQYHVKAKKKEAALEEMKALYLETYGWEYGSKR